MISRRRGILRTVVRDELSTTGLIRRFLVTLVVAAVAGTVAGLAGSPFLAADRNPALLVGEAVGLLVLVVTALVTAWHSGRATILRMVLLALWLAFVAAMAPGLAWFVLWLSDGSGQSLLGLAAVVLGGVPLATAYQWPRALPAVVACCLLGPIAMLTLWQRLYLLEPFALAVAAGWVVALALLGRAGRAKNVVPSN